MLCFGQVAAQTEGQCNVKFPAAGYLVRGASLGFAGKRQKKVLDKEYPLCYNTKALRECA